MIARKNKFGYQSGTNSFINWDSFFSIPLMSRYKQVLQTKKNLGFQLTKIKNLKFNLKEDINLRRSFYVDSLKKGEGGGGGGGKE